MPDGDGLTLTLHGAIAEIAPDAWDACAGADNPFVSHAFLSAIEDSGSTGPRTGWVPRHAVLRGELVVRGSARIPPEGCVTINGRLVWRPPGVEER
jgi:predicted N-acyltransferase